MEGAGARIRQDGDYTKAREDIHQGSSSVYTTCIGVEVRGAGMRLVWDTKQDTPGLETCKLFLPSPSVPLPQPPFFPPHPSPPLPPSFPFQNICWPRMRPRNSVMTQMHLDSAFKEVGSVTREKKLAHQTS